MQFKQIYLENELTVVKFVSTQCKLFVMSTCDFTPLLIKTLQRYAAPPNNFTIFPHFRNP